MKRALFAVVASVACVAPALAHHSFAMFDQTKTVTWTGVATRFVAQANHAELHFVAAWPGRQGPARGDGKPISWGVEMAGAAAVAQQGITVQSFPAGTIFSGPPESVCATAVTSARASAPSRSARKGNCPTPASTATRSRASSCSADRRSSPSP